ncbi:hypothetical protein [Flavihumibacter petaseus]|uniref:Uncharacterized protein n=1 Tax=Flavihumibacter petaseus NBRC 106054 TaxID=1220578 RepID=A0A0E9MWE7_9BACT|nr:hypothetical protein [Flavihumibacter petaseus]GAO42062.1 hypothetical protein FPE01S_01_10750 [Flavihumibacter petaseus NBRC 106054]
MPEAISRKTAKPQRRDTKFLCGFAPLRLGVKKYTRVKAKRLQLKSNIKLETNLARETPSVNGQSAQISEFPNAGVIRG